jgi:hypothetical protein
VLKEADPANAEMLGFYELYHKHVGVNPAMAAAHLAKIHAARGAMAANHRRVGAPRRRPAASGQQPAPRALPPPTPAPS